MFESFISLGSACPVASSMAKYGLRSWSGPFDWLVTNRLDAVLLFLQSDFQDFIQRDSLCEYNDNPAGLYDRRNGFRFLHEQSCSLGYDYDAIELKYQRRINKFLHETQKKVCFLRSVNTKGEIEYILKNHEYINEVIKKRNSQNQIIFLIDKDLQCPDDFLFWHYNMRKVFSGESRELLRGWFDDADEFLTFCVQNYSPALMMRNIAFDWRTADRKMDTMDWTITKLQSQYENAWRILRYDFDKIRLPKAIIIYGAGNIGRILYENICDKCIIKYFVDKDKSKTGDKINGIPVVKLTEVEWAGEIFVITPMYDYECIYKSIRERYKKAIILSLTDILK